MAFDFSQQVTRPYINRTVNGFEQVAITYAANAPFYFSCRFKAGWDGADDKFLMSLQNGDVDGAVFNYGLYTNRLYQYPSIYDTGTLTFQNITRKLDLAYDGANLNVYLDNQLVSTRSVSIAAATYLRIGEYHNYASADSWIGEIWDWMFVTGTTRYISPTGVLYMSDGTSYTTLADTQPVNPYVDSFKYRTIYTHGYVSGGYKDSSPWKNVNRTVHATDITTNLGDKLDYGAAYVDGGYSDYNLYVYGVADAFDGASTWTSSVSMVTETGRAHNTAWDTKTTRGDVGCMVNSNATMGYITAGNSTATDKHNYVTETMYAVGSAPAGPTAGASYGNVAEWHGQYKGWIWAGGGGNFTFSTETWSSGGTTLGNDGWGKALSSKYGHAYAKAAGNTTASIYKLNDTTGAQMNTSLTAPDGAAGEENYEMGQDWGYCLGHYNGAQNNNTYKVNYVTDVMTNMGSDCQPKGHAGMSSGATAPAAAVVTGMLY